jgi:glyoxylase-like metal-dependent hydrolase (beta-lactamase superfamily II)
MPRRPLIVGVAVASVASAPIALGGSSKPTLPVPVEGHEVTQIGPGYYTFRYTGTRNIFLITDAGVIVTDPIEPAAARVMRDEIHKLTDQPVRYVVYSHEHWDHILGGRIFKDEGATFISHENCIAHFYDLPHPDLVMPDRTFSGDLDLELGGRTLRLTYLGRNHGDCLVIMQPDGSDVPFINDLATAGGTPLPGMSDYSLHNWIRSLRELESWDFEQYVGGHGIPLAPKAALTERRTYLEALMQAVKSQLDAGTPEREIPAIVIEALRPQFGHLRNFDAWAPGNARRVITYYGMGW